MKSISNITGKYYEEEECVFFRNLRQSTLYIEWGAELMDLIVDTRHSLVFVFKKCDHSRLKARWELNKDIVRVGERV